MPCFGTPKATANIDVCNALGVVRQGMESRTPQDYLIISKKIENLLCFFIRSCVLPTIITKTCLGDKSNTIEQCMKRRSFSITPANESNKNMFFFFVHYFFKLRTTGNMDDLRTLISVGQYSRR